jgi:hypothetical protein
MRPGFASRGPRRGYVRAILALAAIASLGTSPAWPAEAERQWRAVEGHLVQKLFADHELGDATHYSYSFRHDGTFVGFEMGKDVRGTWRSTAQQICWTWTKPRGSEECYEVQRSGNDVRLFRHGYEALSGTLTPLRPDARK